MRTFAFIMELLQTLWPRSHFWFPNRQFFLRGEMVNPTLNPQHGEPGPIFITHGTGWPQALCTYFSRLLRHAWATVGLFFNPGHYTGYK